MLYINSKLLKTFGKKYPKGAVLCQENEDGNCMFIIYSGKVSIHKNCNGENRLITTLGDSDFFGEMALLEQMLRTATATVVEDGELSLLYTATLEALMRDHPQIGVKLLRNMAIMLSALLRKTNRELDTRAKAS